MSRTGKAVSSSPNFLPLRVHSPGSPLSCPHPQLLHFQNPISIWKSPPICSLTSGMLSWGVRRWKPRKELIYSGLQRLKPACHPRASGMRSRTDPGCRHEGHGAEGAAVHLSAFCSRPPHVLICTIFNYKGCTVFNYKRPTRMSHDENLPSDNCMATVPLWRIYKMLF